MTEARPGHHGAAGARRLGRRRFLGLVPAGAAAAALRGLVGCGGEAGSAAGPTSTAPPDPTTTTIVTTAPSAPLEETAMRIVTLVAPSASSSLTRASACLGPFSPQSSV